MRLMLFLSSCLCAAAAAADWEAALPKGGETDPVALNTTAGTTAPDMVKGARGVLQPLTFPELKPKAAHDGLFRVVLQREGVALPPDMAGAGPFFVVRVKGMHHLLTRRNFAKLFGPVAAKADVLPYVQVFDRVFEHPHFTKVVTSREETEGFQKVPPPAITEIVESDGSYDVRLILYSSFRVRAFYEERLRVGRDGGVEVKEKTRVLKELGPGIMY